MVTRKIYKTNTGKFLVSIPSFLRDKLGLESFDNVDVTDIDGKIVITPIKEH